MESSFSIYRPSPSRRLVGLIVFLAVTLLAGGIGVAFTLPSIPTWYAALAKPAWTPPEGVFGPVWTVLYLLMAFAAWLVWARVGRRGAGYALTLYFVQLALNALWPLLFFTAHLFLPALIEIAVLAVLILATLVSFGRFSRPAAWMMVPYLAWVCFAAALNAGIWWLNT